MRKTSDKFMAGDFFIRISQALFGRFVGGPAKIATISSALMGTLSGNAVGNAVSTGMITIPMMKRSGYAPEYAAAVEAAASSGGQIMPPVMGATAFLIAQYLGVSYWDVVVASAIPAVLYFGAIFFSVHFEAIRLGIRGLSGAEVPSFFPTLRQGLLYLVPIAVLVYFLASGYTALRAGTVALVSLLAVVSLRPEARRGWMRRLSAALQDASHSLVPVATATGIAGVVIGVLTLTGVGLRLSSIVVDASHGNLYLALLYTMLISVVLGMGMPPVAVYIIQASLVVPALIRMGTPEMAAHLFVFYFSILSGVTPPIAVVAYAAAGISGSNPTRTGYKAFVLALAGFIVPFLFVFNPAFLMQGPAWEVALALVSGLVGVAALAGAIEGYFFFPCRPLDRVLLLMGALTLIEPGWRTDLVGAAMVGLTLLLGKGQRRPAAVVAARTDTEGIR